MQSNIKLPSAEELYDITREKVLVPWNEEQMVPLIHDSVIAEIDEQGLIKTGAFRRSIMTVAYEDLHIECGTNPEDNIFYAVFLEFGTKFMQAFAPFRKSVARVQEGLKRIKFKGKKR